MDFASTMKAWKKEQDAYVALGLALIDSIESIVDVDAWWRKAEEIGELCQKLVTHQPGTIFYNPMKSISPKMYGSAHSFRSECIKLLAKMEEFNDWRKSQPEE